MTGPYPQIVRVPTLDASPSVERTRLVRRARLLSVLSLGWHAGEFAVAVAAGIAASSIALVGFGMDSLIEAAAGGVVLWRFGADRASSVLAEHRAQRMIALSFLALAAYVTVQALRTLFEGQHPEPSLVGIGLAAVTAPSMPALAWAKRRLGRQLGSAATVSEGAQNLLCAYLAVGLLLGLGLNALFGWWWADPLAALAIAGVAVKEGLDAWRGDSCCEACGGER